jgi:hypothetical protein
MSYFCNQVLNYQLNFKSLRVISLFIYLGQLGIFSSLFVIFFVPEFLAFSISNS